MSTKKKINLINLRSRIYIEIDAAKKFDSIKLVLEKAEIDFLIDDIFSQLEWPEIDTISLESSLDLVRRCIWDLDSVQEYEGNRNNDNLIDVYVALRTSLSELYYQVLDLYKGKLKVLPFNYWLFKKLMADDRKYGFPILRMPINSQTIPEPPAREPNFVESIEDIEDVFTNLLVEGKPSYCISGIDPGDENAGVGKTTLAKEISNLLLSSKPLSEFSYLAKHKESIELVEKARQKYSEGIIWLSLESHKNSKETYTQIIANAIGLDYLFPKSENEDEELELSETEIMNLKKRFLLISLIPDSKEGIDQASDREIEVEFVKIAEKLGINESEFIEAALSQLNLTEEDFNRKIIRSETKASEKERNQKLIGKLFEDHSKLIGEKPAFTLEQLKWRDEEKEKQKHNQIDSLEKIALILSSRKILIVLDNVEQDRETFEYLYLRLRDFISILITCRLELPGIKTLKLRNFDFISAKKFFYSFRGNDLTVPDDHLERIFDLLKNNPFCLSLLRYNLKEEFKNVGDRIISELEEKTPDDRTTVRRIMVCLDVTNALSEEEKQILFDAYLFFTQSFSAKELSYYYPLKRTKEVQEVIHRIYNDKRIIRIYDQKEEETLYEFQQGVVDYLDEWFQRKEGSFDLNLEDTISYFKEEMNKFNGEKIQKLPSGYKRLDLYIKQLRYILYLKAIDESFKIEIFWGSILYEYSNYIEEYKFFIKKALSNKKSKHNSFYQYSDALSETRANDYYLSLLKCTIYDREALKKLNQHEFKNGLNFIGRRISNDFLDKNRIDYALSCYTSVFNDNLNNKLVALDGLIFSYVDFYSDENFLNHNQLLNIDEDLFNWKYVSKMHKYNYLLYQDINLAKKEQREILELVPKYCEEFENENIANIKIPLLILEHKYQQADTNLSIINANSHAIWTKEVDEDDLMEWEGEIAIGLKDDKRITKSFDKIISKFKQSRNITYKIMQMRLKSLEELSQNNYEQAILNIENAIATQQLYGIKYMPKEKNVKQKIISKIGKHVYSNIKSNLSFNADHSYPAFINLPYIHIDKNGKKMILIHEGRVIKYDGRMNFLLDIKYALKIGKDFLEDKISRKQFNDEELLYPFYVDENPVTENEFKEYFASLPFHQRSELPQFNAENVNKFAQAQGKLPIIEIEWQKIYEGINYNLSNTAKFRKGDHDPALEKRHNKILKITTIIQDDVRTIKENLIGITYDDEILSIEGTRINKSICRLLAYSFAFGRVTQKMSVLDRLSKDKTYEKELFEILKNELLETLSLFEGEEKDLEMAWNSQKNIWAITLRYFMGLEDSFKLVKENDQEAVLIENDGKEDMFVKEALERKLSYRHPANPDVFIPFRCVKMWYDVVKK